MVFQPSAMKQNGLQKNKTSNVVPLPANKYVNSNAAADANADGDALSASAKFLKKRGHILGSPDDPLFLIH